MGTGSSNPVFGPWREDRKILTYFKFDQNLGREPDLDLRSDQRGTPAGASAP